MKSPFEVVSGVFQSVPLMLGMAHACANVYNRSIGQPDVNWDHNHPEFRLNVCGGIAADSAANAIAARRVGPDDDGNISTEAYVDALEDIRDDNLTDEEQFVAQNVANATWRTAQYGRSEDRWSRSVNTHFCLLSEKEKPKDTDQLIAGAAYLLDQIAKNS